MARSFVSVLIDTYNHEKFIEQAIVSVLQQDFPEAEREVIVVDDGSTDRTPEIVRKFEPRVRLLRKPNGGQASAFNTAIPECQGEIVAFLDGDDWWARGKLKAVTAALEGETLAGLVGHGITEVFSDGRENAQLLRDGSRFRINSEAGARTFRLRKSFLGTSRMTIRASVLRDIGQVPKGLAIQADEYLFTLAAFLSDAVILRESFAFYRLHGSNAFQISDGSKISLRRKQTVLELLAKTLSAELERRNAEKRATRVVLDALESESELIRLSLDAGWPWETVHTEWRNYRIMHPDAALLHRIFKCVGLLPALLMPSRAYYSWRQSFSQNRVYRRVREKWLPFLHHSHIERSWTTKL